MEFNNVFQILNVDFSEFRKIYSNLSKLSDEEISSHLKNINCFESRTTFESLYNVDFKGDQVDIKCSNTLIIHVYYPYIIKTFEPYIINALICGANIIVNIPDHNGQNFNLIKEYFDSFELPSRINIIKSKNTGRDWGGLYKSFMTNNCGDVITFIHTKFSPHLHPIFGMLWRQRLISPLLGTVSNYQNNLELISRQFTTLVASDSCKIKIDNTSKKDYEKFNNIFSLKIDNSKNQSTFIPGSMFMVHKDVLHEIFSTLNKLTHNELNEDFNNISMKDQIGGKLPHYLERYIFAYAEQLNGITAI